jgi:hypothetical protein
MISPSLRSKVVNFDFYTVIQKHDIFKFDQRVVDKILEHLQIKFQSPGECVLKQN